MNVYQILTDSAHLFAQKPAIIFKDKKVSFADLKANGFGFGAGFAGIRIGSW